MYCVIQEIENKRENQYGAAIELEAYKNEYLIMGQEHISYSYRYTGGRFKRPVKKAYKISIHHSYREDGKVKKRQWVIGTMDYYYIADNGGYVGDCCNLKKKAELIGIDVEELYGIISMKLDPLREKIENEFHETEEYKTKAKHEGITTLYIVDKMEFKEEYGKDTYEYYYDVFRVLREPKKFEEFKKQYEAAKEYQRSYHENYKSNYNSSYQNSIGSNHNEENKDKYKKLYKTLAKTYHPDIIKDDGEMMKLVNQLKEEWGL